MLRTFVAFLCLSLCFAVSAHAQDEAKLLAAFTKTLTPPPKGKASTADKLAALETLAALDSGKTAEALAEGWLAVAAQLQGLDAERDAKNAEMAEIVKGQEASEHRTFDQGKHARYNQLKGELTDLRARADDLRSLNEKIAERVAALHRRDSALWLLQKIVGQKKVPMPIELAAAKAIGGAAAEVLEELSAALVRAKEPETQLVLLDAMAMAGKVAQPHATPVIALLDSKEVPVAERAAAALAKIAVPEAIGPMVALLSRIDGQDRLRVAASLEILTGEQFGDNASMWRAWWQKDGAMFVASGKPLGAGQRSSNKKDEGRYYFGIPQQDSKSILYVIDCSGSMKAEIGWPGKDGKEMKTTRIEACKLELVRALGLLQPTQRFGILWYNDLPHFWESQLQAASKDVVAKAQAFVDTLKPASSTNIHDSLEQCFKLIGRGSHDKHYAIDIDTIFLLTDGSPTTTDGKPDSTEKILLGVRAWNPLQRVTLHCIAIGKDLNESFLRQLASENGGQFKQF